ncbi:MAG: tRNA glutamyl-Q(34) synthetase GluQRS [Rhodobacteraceae bacterium]|nr:tRNA glutamyl-Q(34) synthetase GluQRS [Paracoccaceae bacterium]
MIQRFAPSPTGPLHLGHAFSALLAFRAARAARGTFLLRIEDIDQARSRPEWEAAIFDDLAWLGLSWPRPVMRQSDRLPVYRAALDRLSALGLLYPCRCRRRDIAAALAAPQEGAQGLRAGPDGPVYPGTCRGRPMAEAGPEDALRLDMGAALAHLGPARLARLAVLETGPAHGGRHPLSPAHLLEGVGDVVLARRDFGTSYHLAVVVDDAAQGVTHVTRGEDLFDASVLHLLLQALLELPHPVWHHHGLIRDAAGRRLAKRDDARALYRFRDEGASPADICRMVGLAA